MKKSALAVIVICLFVTICGCGSKKGSVAGNESTIEENESVIVMMSEEDGNSVDVTSSEEVDTEKDTADTTDNSSEDAGEGDDASAVDDGIPFDTHGKLSLKGLQLVDRNNSPYQLKGVSTHGIGWFPEYVNKDTFRTLRDDWGVNCIRLAMYSDEGAGYCTDGDKAILKALVNDGVGYATELGMYVIIDWHVLGEHDPNVHKNEAVTFFDEMSKRYADCDNVLYEICNEPNGGVNWSSVKSYAEEVIPVIKANNSDAIIIVGTPNWSQDVDLAAKDPISGYTNILYTIHFYADTHKDDLRSKAQTAIDAGLPLFCSEFGICDASGNGNCNTAEANKWIDYLNDNGISYCIWNLSNKDESSSLISSSSFSLSDWSYEELSEEGKWYVDMLGKKAGSLSGEKKADDSAEKDSDQTESSSSDDGNNDSDTDDRNKNPEHITSTNGKVSVDVLKNNSWNDGKKEFSQYRVTINNNDTGHEINGWSIKVEFNDNITLDQNWCSNCQVTGNCIVISSVDYNATIPGRGSIGDIGLIISSDRSVQIKKISVNE